jgi:hypothetical protein
MPGSPYLDERPPGLLTWPLLMPLLLAVFLVELIIGIYVWMEYPDWRFLVYALLGIDLIILIAFYVLTTRAKGVMNEGEVE